jgi:hypothetical protein
MERPTILATALLVLALAVASPTAAQVPDYSGTWQLDSFAELPNDGGTCTFTGRVTLEQMGDTLSGDAFQTLVDGPMLCPPTMMAALGGQVDPEGCVVLGALLGPLGEVTFVGCPGDMMDTLEGDWTAESGPFAGAAGGWSAARLPPSVLEVPSLSTVGLVALGLLLLTSALWMLRRRTSGGDPPPAWG